VIVQAIRMLCFPSAVVIVKYLPMVDQPSQPSSVQRLEKSEENFMNLLLAIMALGSTLISSAFSFKAVSLWVVLVGV